MIAHSTKEKKIYIYIRVANGQVSSFLESRMNTCHDPGLCPAGFQQMDMADKSYFLSKKKLDCI